MATQRKHQPRSRRRSGRLFRVYILLSALVIVAAVVAGSLVFFKANRFEVEGNLRYSDEELLEASGLQEGDNLLRIPRREIARRMEENLPYLKQVNIQLLPPERVIIHVVETQPAGTIQVESNLWYLDSGGKLLEMVSENQGFPEITGLTPLEPEVGTMIQVAEEDGLRLKGLKGVLAALEDRNLIGQVQAVDVSSASYLTIRYQNRLTVKMGLADDFEYDMKMLEAAQEQYIRDNWAPDETGTLDMTRSEGQAVLTPDSGR